MVIGMVPDKLYTAGDMVRINCNGCMGCSYCCQEMGESVVLTPLDLYELTVHLGQSFDVLMEDKIELYMTDGMVLPNLKMRERRMPGEDRPVKSGVSRESGRIPESGRFPESGRARESGRAPEPEETPVSGGAREACGFLSAEGRCSIHDFRPGLCRLFPLGRNYEVREIRTAEGVQEVKGFQYFVVKDSCPKLPGTKVKIEKWLGIPNLKKNEEFITKWHYFCRDFQEEMQELLAEGKEEQVKRTNLTMLELFYRKPYEEGRDFYEQFEERIERYCARPQNRG